MCPGATPVITHSQSPPEASSPTRSGTHRKSLITILKVLALLSSTPGIAPNSLPPPCLGLPSTPRPLLLLGLLRAATNNLDLVGLYRLAAVIELKRHVADQERPDFVAEAVRIERTLCAIANQPCSFPERTTAWI